MEFFLPKIYVVFCMKCLRRNDLKIVVISLVSTYRFGTLLTLTFTKSTFVMREWSFINNVDRFKALAFVGLFLLNKSYVVSYTFD